MTGVGYKSKQISALYIHIIQTWMSILYNCTVQLYKEIQLQKDSAVVTPSHPKHSSPFLVLHCVIDTKVECVSRLKCTVTLPDQLVVAS